MHCLIYEISFLGERESIIEQKPIFFFMFICQERIDGWGGHIKICKIWRYPAKKGKSHIVDIGILSFTKTFDICFCVSFSSITKKKSDRNGSSKVW